MSPEEKPSKPLDVYVRVSRVGGRTGESFISPQVQEERCRAMATAKGYKVGKVFTDLDQSGGKMSRPEFEKAMDRIREGKSGGIIVQKLDRFARNVSGLLTTVDEMEQHGAAFICVEPSIDTGDPDFGRFLLTLFGALAELELGRIRTAWATAHANHIARGVPTGRAPAGYRKDDSGRLVVIPEHAAAVKEAFELRAAGKPWSQVRDLLEERGVPTSGGERWITRTASRLLANRTLLGEVRFGDLVETENAHPAIIDKRLFDRVQKTREQPAARERKEPSLLAGILRCDSCGRRMNPDKSMRDGKPYPFYRCRGEYCEARASIGTTIVEGYLTEEALAHAGTVWGTEKLGDDSGFAEAQARLSEARADLAEVEEAFAAGQMNPAAYGKALTAAQTAIAAAEDAVAEAAEAGTVLTWFIPAPGEGETTTRTVFDRMPVDKQRQALAAIIEKATVKTGTGKVKDRVKIEWKAVA